MSKVLILKSMDTPKKMASRKRKLDSENGTTPTKNGAIPTKKHKFLSLSEKIEIIKYHENGASYAKIC